MVVLGLIVGISFHVEQILLHLLSLLNWVHEFFWFVIDSLHQLSLTVDQILHVRQALLFSAR
jgi:hypothetical protein